MDSDRWRKVANLSEAAQERVPDQRGGLSVELTAAVLKISAPTVMRDWKVARAWLGAEMGRLE